MRCAWCGESLALGIVTPGGVVYHLACRRRRDAIRRDAECIASEAEDGYSANSAIFSKLHT